MDKFVAHPHQLPYGPAAGARAWRRMLSAGLLGALCMVGTPCEAIGIGTFRCVSFNVGGAGGRCTNAPPIDIRPDGSYSESSTTGRYTISNGRILFSQSTIRGPGELIDDNTIRFQYTYKGLAHTATYLCAGCSGTPAPATQARPGGAAPARVGVTLHIEFSQGVSGATGFAIIPRELASQFEHHSPLPAGAVSGLVIDVSPTQVRLVTNRYNQLAVKQHYVVFLSYAAETVAVAAFYLPAVPSDYEGRLRGDIYRHALPQAARIAPANNPEPLPASAPPSPSQTSGLSAPYPSPEAPSPHAYPAPPGAAYPAPTATAAPAPPTPYPAGTPVYPAPPGAPQAGTAPGATNDPVQSLEGLARALKTLGDLFNSFGQPRQSPPMGLPPPNAYPSPPPATPYPSPLPGSSTPPSAYPALPAEAPSSYPPAASAYPPPSAEAPSGYPPPSAYPVAPSGPAPAPAPPPPPTAAYPSAPSPAAGPRCNPSIPKYSQPGCVE